MVVVGVLAITPFYYGTLVGWSRLSEQEAKMIDIFAEEFLGDFSSHKSCYLKSSIYGGKKQFLWCEYLPSNEKEQKLRRVGILRRVQLLRRSAEVK